MIKIQQSIESTENYAEHLNKERKQVCYIYSLFIIVFDVTIIKISKLSSYQYNHDFSHNMK